MKTFETAFAGVYAEEEYLVMIETDFNSVQIWPFTELLSLRFFHHVRSVINAAKNEDLDSIQYVPSLRNTIIFPDFVNLTHIYTLYQVDSALKSAIDDKCPLIMSLDNVSALSLALEHQNFVLIRDIVDFIANNPTRANLRLCNGNLPTLNQMKLAHLSDIYENAFIAQHDRIPKFIVPKEP
jgi:hypothetical protein